MTDPIPAEAVEAAAIARWDFVRAGIPDDTTWDMRQPHARRFDTDCMRAALTAAAPHIAAQATRDVRAERDSILRRIDRLESDESWWVGGAWGDYGEAVIPLRALSTLTGPLADDGPEWETDPGFAATWGDLRATVEEQASELSDLRAGIEALRDEWRTATVRRVELDGQAFDRPKVEYLSHCADALDALLRGGVQ